MTEILYLVHRLPYPPNKGDKIRSFHLLRYLAARHDVHMGSFIDSDDDAKYVEKAAKYCRSNFVGALNRRKARARSIKGFLSGDALSLPYYYDKVLAEWIDDVLDRRQISAIVTFCSPMGQYVLGPKFSEFTRIMDFVDIDSDKWRQYAKQARAPMSWVYAREATLLSEFERGVTNDFDAVVFVSENETDMFAIQSPETRNKQFTVCNGVATDYFDPALEFSSPFNDDALPIVFTGMMNYLPNIDAMCWFARSVLPETRRIIANAELWIVGASPTKEIRELNSVSGINVTGRVRDVRPYLKHAAVVVAPLRIARGVQNKVLEALAMGKPVVCTPQAAAGLSDIQAAPIKLARSEAEFADCVAESIRSENYSGINYLSREYVEKNYDWDRNLSFFDELLNRGHTSSNAEVHAGSVG